MSLPMIQKPDVAQAFQFVSGMKNALKQTIVQGLRLAEQVGTPPPSDICVPVSTGPESPAAPTAEDRARIDEENGTSTPCGLVDLPPIPAGHPGESFQDGMLRMINGVGAQLDAVKAKLLSGTVEPKDMVGIQMQYQELLNFKSELTATITNMMKAEHEMAMSVIRNLSA